MNASHLLLLVTGGAVVLCTNYTTAPPVPYVTPCAAGPYCPVAPQDSCVYLYHRPCRTLYDRLLKLEPHTWMCSNHTECAWNETRPDVVHEGQVAIQGVCRQYRPCPNVTLDADHVPWCPVHNCSLPA